MVVATRLTDDSFEQWLGQINSACGRFCAKTLAPGFAGAIQEFHSHALRLSIVDAAQTRLYRTRREVEQSDGCHFLPYSNCVASRLWSRAIGRRCCLPGISP